MIKIFILHDIYKLLKNTAVNTVKNSQGITMETYPKIHGRRKFPLKIFNLPL